MSDHIENFNDEMLLFAEFPKSLQTKEQLVEYLTVVIFTASAHHAGVNFGQVS